MTIITFSRRRGNSVSPDGGHMCNTAGNRDHFRDRSHRFQEAPEGVVIAVILTDVGKFVPLQIKLMLRRI